MSLKHLLPSYGYWIHEPQITWWHWHPYPNTSPHVHHVPRVRKLTCKWDCCNYSWFKRYPNLHIPQLFTKLVSIQNLQKIYSITWYCLAIIVNFRDLRRMFGHGREWNDLYYLEESNLSTMVKTVYHIHSCLILCYPTKRFFFIIVGKGILLLGMSKFYFLLHLQN